MRRLVLLMATAACVVTACAKATTQSGGGSARRANSLTSEQLIATNSDNLFDAISKLRPEWMSSRGPVAVLDARETLASVFMDGSLLGRVDYLKNMRVLDVTEVRYWDAGSASARFGMGHPRGVIELSRK